MYGSYENYNASVYTLDTAKNNANIKYTGSPYVLNKVSAEYMKSEEFYNKINTDGVWLRRENDYPKLNAGIPSSIQKMTELEVKNTYKRYKISVDLVKDNGQDEDGGTGKDAGETVNVGENSKEEYKFIPDKDYEIEYININGTNQKLELDENRAYTIPAGYFLNVQEDKKIVVKYKALDNLKIEKVDKNDESKKLSDAKFEIVCTEDETKTVVTTNTEGIATARIQNDKEYKVTEISAPVGYNLSTEPQTVTIQDQEFATLKFQNEKKSENTKITKVDEADSNKKLPNAEFKLTNKVDKNAEESTFLAYMMNKKLSEDKTTINDILNRNYNMTLNSGTANISSQNELIFDGSTSWTINNWQEGSIGTYEIEVAIDKNFTPVNNSSWYCATCILGCELPYTQKDFGILLNSKGEACIGYDFGTIASSGINIKDGKYHNIALTFDKNKITLYVDGKSTSVTYTANGDEIPKIGIGWNADSTITAIKGKVKKVKVYNKVLTSNEILRDFNDDQILNSYTLTTDENGEIKRYLENGFYKLKETKAPEGYELNSDEIEFEKTDENLNMTITNKAKEKILTPTYTKEYNCIINKVDNLTKLPLKGVKFEILDENGNNAYDLNGKIVGDVSIINGQEKNVVTTDSKGQVKLLLRKGKYTAVELENPYDYKLISKEFEIKDENVDYELAWYKDGVLTDNSSESVFATKDGGAIVYVKNKTIPAEETENGEAITIGNNDFGIVKYNKNGKVEKYLKTSMPNALNRFDKIVQDNEGNYLVMGSAFGMSFTSEQMQNGKPYEFIRYEGPPRFFILKLNKDLKVINGFYSKDFYTTYKYTEINQNNSGDYNITFGVCAMSSSTTIGAESTTKNKDITMAITNGGEILLKLDNNLKIEFIKNFPSNAPAGKIKEISENNYIIYGGSLLYNATVSDDDTLQMQGNIVSINPYIGFGYNSIAVLSDGSVVECGSVGTNSSTLPGSLTATGEEMKITVADTPALSIAKYNLEGKIIWQKIYDISKDASVTETLHNIKETVNGDYIATATIGNEQKLLEFDNEFNLVKEIDIPQTSKIYIDTNTDNTQVILYTNQYTYSYNIGKSEFKPKEVIISNQNEGTVKVHYYLKNDNQNNESTRTNEKVKIAEDEDITGVIGDEYSVTPKAKIGEYELIKDESDNYIIPENASGVIKEENKDVDFYYEKAKAKLTINYYEDGTQNKLQESTIEKLELGSSYNINTEENVPSHYVYTSSSNELTGVINNDTEISLYYRKEQYKIKTRVQQIEGTTEYGGSITGDKLDVLESVEYGNKIKNEIIAKAYTGYRFKSVKANEKEVAYNKDNDGNIHIQYTEPITEDTEFVAEFEANNGKVIAHHYLENTTEKLHEDTIFTNKVGSEVKTEQQEIEGYELVNKPENETIQITENAQEVVYYYQKKMYIKTSVTNHTEKYTDGKILQNVEGGTISGQDNEYYEMVLKGRKANKTINIIPNDGYEIVKIKVNSKEYNFKNNLTESGNIVINAEKLGEITEDKNIEVEFRKTSSVIVKYTDKDTKQSLYQSEDGKDYIEISGYESKQIKTEEKIFTNYQKSNPFITDSNNKQIKEEIDMFADNYTVTYWFERIPSGIVARHIEIDSKGNTKEIELENITGKAGLTELVNRKEYKKYISANGPENTEENVIIANKNEQNKKVTYIDGMVPEVWFYYQRNCEISTKIDSNEETDTSKLGNIYQFKINEDGTEQKVDNEIVLKGDNAKYNVKVVPNYGYKIGAVIFEKTKYYKPEEVAENEEQNKEITTKNINIEKYKNDDGSLIITTDSDILQNIDGDYKFIVKFEKIPSKVLVKYIEEETGKVIYKQENGKEYDEIIGYVNDEYETKIKEIKNYEIDESKLPNNAKGKMLPEETTVIYYYKKAMLDFKVEKEIVKLEINDEVQTEFSNKKLVEAKIKYSDINSAKLKVFYKVTVKNVGKAYGTATIKEEIPTGMNFIKEESSEEWNLTEQTETLQTQEIAPGEQKEYLVVLNWVQDIQNYGEKVNKATIDNVTNEESFEEIDKDSEENNNTDSSIITIKLEKVASKPDDSKNNDDKQHEQVDNDKENKNKNNSENNNKNTYYDNSYNGNESTNNYDETDGKKSTEEISYIKTEDKILISVFLCAIGLAGMMILITLKNRNS